MLASARRQYSKSTKSMKYSSLNGPSWRKTNDVSGCSGSDSQCHAFWSDLIAFHSLEKWGDFLGVTTGDCIRPFRCLSDLLTISAIDWNPWSRQLSATLPVQILRRPCCPDRALLPNQSLQPSTRSLPPWLRAVAMPRFEELRKTVNPAHLLNLAVHSSDFSPDPLSTTTNRSNCCKNLSSRSESCGSGKYVTTTAATFCKEGVSLSWNVVISTP